MQIRMEFFDPDKSTTASKITCGDDRCTSALQTGESICTAVGSSGSLCDYTFQYGDGSGTSGYYVADMLHFDTITEDEQAMNSSATIVFG
jgi:kinase